MTTPSQNPLLNRLPKDPNTMEVGFLLVILAIIFFIGLVFFILHFGVPWIEEILWLKSRN